MKKCALCGVEKPLFMFNKHKNRKDGHQTACKDCNKSYLSKNYYANHEELKEKCRDYYSSNRDKKLQYHKQHYENNKEQYSAKSANRRSTKLQRTPPWVKGVFVQEIKVIYKRAQLIKAFMGEVWHVDHIVPLKGKTVSGLHVPWNLQLLPAEENLSKGIKFTP
jgi:hypothetical protein